MLMDMDMDMDIKTDTSNHNSSKYNQLNQPHQKDPALQGTSLGKNDVEEFDIPLDYQSLR